MSSLSPDANRAGPAAKARSAYIDTLRGVAIFGVACIHFGGSFVNVDHAWSPSFYLGLGFGQIFNFAVPLFIFLSGVLAGSSSRDAGSLWDYYRSRLTRIGLPYLAASLVSFFVLNHYPEWQALSTFGEKTAWLAWKLSYYGVVPTLYFIPLILQLYLLQPALKALPRWTQAIARKVVGPAFTEGHGALLWAATFLGLHLVLGVLCYRGTLSYYTWCRPCSLFWMVYFFTGLHFKGLSAFLTRRRWQILAGAALVAAAGAMFMDFSYLLDRTAVGAHFEFNNTDFAYSRPPLLLYDLAVVAACSVGIALGWNWRPNLAAFLGPYTLDIYLWHILLLYEGAWRHAEVLEACRQMPEVILMISASACLLLAGAKHLYVATVARVRQYRLVLIHQPW